jgi:hypothetical protein
MEDADELWAAVKGSSVAILTALPKADAERVDKQKRRWVANRLDYKARVITCLTKDKPNYCKPGDVLIDDRTINRKAWQDAGGVFIHHTSATRSVHTLIALGII